MQAVPAGGEVGFDIVKVQRAGDGVIYEVADGLGVRVKGGDRRHEDGAHFGELGHGAEVPQVKRGFADHEDEAAALFEDDVGGAGHQCVGGAIGDFAHSADGAGGDDHAVCAEGAAGDAGADIAGLIEEARFFADLIEAEA